MIGVYQLRQLLSAVYAIMQIFVLKGKFQDLNGLDKYLFVCKYSHVHKIC